MIWYYKEKKDKSDWNKKFAWLPTKIGNAGEIQEGDMIIWLCFYERKWYNFRGTHSYYTRLIQKENINEK